VSVYGRGSDIGPTGQPSNPSDAQALKILDIENSLPWIQFSPELYSTLQNYFTTWPPSTTLQSKVAWICIRNPRPYTAGDTDTESTDYAGLDRAWRDLCARRKPTAADLDDLARRFNELSGKWMVFSKHNTIDSIWSRIAEATHSGKLGPAAKVSPRNESDSHVICVYTRDFTDEGDVRRVRNGLRRLGVKGVIGYKPDIYTHCAVYRGNAWGIPPTRYRL
jgi:hypothetical protein